MIVGTAMVRRVLEAGSAQLAAADRCGQWSASSKPLSLDLYPDGGLETK